MAYVIIVGMPFLVFILFLAWRFAAGPFWLGNNADGPYQYLINALYLLEHQVPLFVQHPGTPLQILGAVIIKLMNFFVPHQQMIENVLKTPEFYLHAIYAVLIIFYTITLIVLAYYAYRHTRDWMVALLVQTPALLYLTMCQHAGPLEMPINMCAETLLPGLLNLYGVCLLRSFFIEDKTSVLWTALGWGAVYGILVATKFTSLSLFVIPLTVLPAFRNKLLFCLAAGVFFGLATMPAWSRYPMIWGNLFGMLTHTAFRGQGPRGLIAWESFRHGAMFIFAHQWLLMCGVLLSLGIICYKSIVLQSWHKLNKAYRWATWTAGAIILQFLMVAKEPQNYYMIPAMGLFGFLWALMYRGRAGKSWAWRWAVLFFIVMNLALSFIYMGNFYRSSQSTQAFSKEVYGQNKGIICGYYRSSSVPFALVMGDDNYGLKRYEGLIQRLYPRAWTMDILQFKIVSPPGGAFIEDALAHGQQVFLYGSAHPEYFFSPLFKVKRMAQSGDEAVYGVLQANDRDAFQFFYMAQMALMQGQGQVAYGLGMRAKDLGLPVAHDFIDQMDRIISKNN